MADDTNRARHLRLRSDPAFRAPFAAKGRMSRLAAAESSVSVSGLPRFTLSGLADSPTYKIR
jgi:hypothetical protein